MESVIKKEFINKIELFKGLSPEELQELCNNVIEMSFQPSDIIFAQSTPREYIYIIYEGEIELYQTSPYGERRRLVIFNKYDFFGEGSMMDDSPHSTTASALLPTLILAVENNFFKKHGEIAVKVLSNVAKVISRRMRHANSKMISAAAQYESGRTRMEHDLLGDREVPNEFYYGVQTLRALENFNITGVALNFYPVIIEALAMVKMAAAKANCDLKLLSKPITDAIVQTCYEIMNGKYLYHFVVDMIQGGAGTSTNMNANEVIANRALEIMGYQKGEYKYCHPNNHVNCSQSTNDVYPSSVKIALYNSNKTLIDVLKILIKEFKKKAGEFAGIIKMGRTQLQDAVPMTLGQEFEAYAVTLEEEILRLQTNAELFLELNMGATAIGTGITADPDYADLVIKYLTEITGLRIVNSPNLVEATQDTGAFVMYSGAIKRLAIKLSKICNDLRLLSSGPRCGLHEINLPPMQPGSSIMPGKVNPVIPEVVNQIAFKVIGNDLTVTLAAEAGQLELNVMEPVIVQSLFESIEMLKNGMQTLTYRCVSGITANPEVCRKMVENSIGLVTALVPILGYESCSQLAKEALETENSVYELVLKNKLLSKEELENVLKPENMIKPVKLKKN